MHLSKIIPSHTYRVDFTWVQRDFTVMDQEYRDIRTRVGGGMDTCDWCKYAFANGDKMALAGRPKGRNWMLCQTCAQMAEGHSPPETRQVPIAADHEGAPVYPYQQNPQGSGNIGAFIGYTNPAPDAAAPSAPAEVHLGEVKR